MKRTTIEFMIGWLDALRRDDVDALKSTLAPDVIWQGLRDEWACHGPDAVIDTFAGEREAKQEIGALELIGADTEDVNGQPLVDWVTRLIERESVDDVHCKKCTAG